MMDKKNEKNYAKNFLFPTISIPFITRLFIVSVLTYLIFNHIFIPLRIRGHSMTPTYKDGQINICWRLKYVFSEPKRHDIVVVRYSGKRIMLLKRVVALEGELIEFREGQLFIDGKKRKEPYVQSPSHWNLPPRRVEKGHIYLMGDNRGISMQQHDFGQTSIKRVMGAPLW